MSLCFKFKLMLKELASCSLRKTKSSCAPLNNQETTKDDSLHHVSLRLPLENTTTVSDINDNNFEAHGIKFSCKEDRDGFILKMTAMKQAFDKELLEISRQHQRFRAGGYLLNSRVLEMERIIRTDQRKGSIDLVKTNNYEPSVVNSQNFQVVHEMDSLCSILDNTNEEIMSLKKYLDIEYKERTLYPEPVMLRSSSIEDEYSRKMKQDGGLSYQSKDNTIKYITYQCLPPPFSLRQISTQ